MDLLLFCFASPLSGCCEAHPSMWMQALVFVFIFFVIFLVTVQWCKVTGGDVLLEEWGRYPTFSKVKGGRGASGFLLQSRG